MKQSTRKWLWISGGIVVLLGIAALAAPFFIPWDKVKDQVAASASKSLGRQLSIGSVELGFLSGVHVKDVKLANAPGAGFSAQPLFSNADAKVSVSLLSLLTGKLVINSIQFDQPQLLIETNAEGVSNLKGLGSAAAKAPASASSAKASAPSALPVVVAALVVDHGEVVIRDKQKKTETAIKGLDLRLYGLSLAAAGGSRLELGLEYDSEGKRIPVKVVCNFKLDLAHDHLSIQSLDANVPAVALNAKADVDQFSAKPKVDADLKVDVDLSALPKLLPPSVLKKIPGDLKSGGKIQLSVQAKGGVADLQAMDVKAQLAFDGVDLAYGSYPGLADLQGTLSVDKAGAKLPALTFKLGGDPVTVALAASWGDLSNLLGGPSALKADVQLSVKSPKLNLDPILAISGGEDAPAAASAKAAAAQDHSLADFRSKVPAGLTFKSLIEVDSLVAKGVSTGKLKQQVQLKARKLQSATDLGLYDGQFWERTSADLGAPGPTWSSQMGLSKLNFAPFIADLAKAMPKQAMVQDLNGKLSGSLGFKADLKGKGFSAGTLMRNLNATGSFFMKDGLLKKLDLQEKLAAAIPHPQTQAILRSDISFANATGDFAVANDAFTLKTFTLGSGDDWRGGDLLVQASGMAVKDGKVDFKIVPHFNPARVHLDGAVGDAFNDANGWPTYNYIAYYGPTAKQAKADFKAGLQNAAKQAVKKQVDKQVDAVKQKAADLVKDKLGNSLKGLFGQ